MKTFILWRGPNDKKATYKGIVGGALWDQFLVNAKNGYGWCYLIDAETVAEAKAKIDLTKDTDQRFIRVYGPNAERITVPI